MGALALGGCSDVYFYWQAAGGQTEIISKRRAIPAVLADKDVDGEIKAKLRLILEAQDFASRELALPRDGHYKYFTDLKREYVSWLVVAAQPLAMEEYRFCYPIAGCLGYRGYFQKADAEDVAADLREEGLDVAVRPVQAYSTLGWFDDPVLNTFLNRGQAELAGLIFHEQIHRLYFLKGDTAFNESFASFVEQEGLRRFLQATSADSAALLRRHAAVRAERELFRQIVLRGRARLVELYRSGLPDAEKRRRKAALFAGMVRDYRNRRQSFKILNYDRWFSQPLNNAHVVGFSQYALHVEAFRALFRQSGSDFRRFYDAVRALGAQPAPVRAARLEELERDRAGASERQQEP